MASSEPTRAELLVAREQLEEQILRLKAPSYLRDKNPVLLARLESVLAEVNEALAASGPIDR
jgi:hypothetical protein